MSPYPDMAKFNVNQIVQATTAIPFGKSSRVPRSTIGEVIAVQGTLTKKYSVRWRMPQYGNPVITVSGNYLQGTYSF